VKTCSACGREYPDDVRFCQNDGTTLRASATSDLIGSVIADRYHITKKLGEGGMGAVYLGEHVKMGRKSAIKVIAQSMSHDVEAIARFNREAANAAQINHPNVCGIYDFGETPEGVIYLAMEFIEGEALTAVLEREGAFSAKRAADILDQTARALQAAHDLGIVHRDLKPDNIMVTRDRDGSDLVKVVDFGIAKAMGGDSEQKVTKTGLVVGTPEYMSPEQLSGDRLDGRSDIYSLGLVLFRMLTGILPFQAESSQEVMIKRLTDDPMQLTDALPSSSFPSSLQAAVTRALQRMPSDRYASAAEFGRDVMSAVSGAPDLGPPRIDAAAATQVFSTDPQGATAQIPDTVVQAKGVSPSRAKQPTTPPTPMPRPSPARKKPVAAIAAVVAVVAVGGIGSLVLLNDWGSDADPLGGQSGVQEPPTLGAETSEDPPESPAGDNADDQSTPSDDRGNATPSNGGNAQPPARTNDQPTGGTPATITVSTTNAGDHIIDLLFQLDGDTPFSIAAAVRDTAQAYYQILPENSKERADAAFLAANAYFELNERDQALVWARRAVNLDPNDNAYQTLLSQLQGNP